MFLIRSKLHDRIDATAILGGVSHEAFDHASNWSMILSKVTLDVQLALEAALNGMLREEHRLKDLYEVQKNWPCIGLFFARLVFKFY